MIRYFLIGAIALVLTACSQADFEDCAAYSDYLTATQTLLTMIDTVLLPFFPVAWSIVLVRKLFFV